MNRIRTVLMTQANRFLEAMAYADPSDLGFYSLEPVTADVDAPHTADSTIKRNTAPARQLVSVAAA
jgi:hypothetical protein